MTKNWPAQGQMGQVHLSILLNGSNFLNPHLLIYRLVRGSHSILIVPILKRYVKAR